MSTTITEGIQDLENISLAFLTLYNNYMGSQKMGMYQSYLQRVSKTVTERPLSSELTIGSGAERTVISKFPSYF